MPDTGTFDMVLNTFYLIHGACVDEVVGNLDVLDSAALDDLRPEAGHSGQLGSKYGIAFRTSSLKTLMIRVAGIERKGIEIFNKIQIVTASMTQIHSRKISTIRGRLGIRAFRVEPRTFSLTPPRVGCQLRCALGKDQDVSKNFAAACALTSSGWTLLAMAPDWKY